MCFFQDEISLEIVHDEPVETLFGDPFDHPKTQIQNSRIAP
jgi:hypothetical protein